MHISPFCHVRPHIVQLNINYNVIYNIKGELVQDYNNIQQVHMIQNYTSDIQKQFKWPYLLAKGPDGELITCNNSEDAKHIVVFDKKLKYKKNFSVKAYETKFECIIRGVAVDSGGFLFVTIGDARLADYIKPSYLHCIRKFSLHNGKFISQFGKQGTENGQFKRPSGLLISKSNMLYVCDRLNHRIQVFHGMNYLFTFGSFSPLQENGTFNEPVDLTMDNSEQKLFITDFRNNRIQVFTPMGDFLTQIRASSSTDPSSHILHPNGIFFTPDNHLLVGSSNGVLIFKEDGTFVSTIRGKCNDKHTIDYIGVIMMNDGKIVVADGYYGTNSLMIFN